MIKILLMLTLICLNLSCRDNAPTISDQEQLTPVFRYFEDGSIDVENSYCLSRVYRITKDYIGPITKSIRVELSECDRIIGRAPAEYGVFATWLSNMRFWIIRQSKD